MVKKNASADGGEPQSKPENFELMLEKLRGIVRVLEAGDAPLEESLLRFSEGVALAKACQERLAKAEQQIELLVETNAEGVKTEPFVGER